MSKREKIIVSLMIASVIFGAYHFLSMARPDVRFRMPGKEPVKKKEKNIAVSLSEKEQYILKQAALPWADDPFITHTSKTKQVKIYPPIPKDLKYSGWLKVENRMLAIINGTEYQIGEIISQTQYLVADISPKQVVIALPGGINPGTVPMMESD
jgi:PhoPQ-activated pathogenicity-related protein